MAQLFGTECILCFSFLFALLPCTLDGALLPCFCILLKRAQNLSSVTGKRLGRSSKSIFGRSICAAFQKRFHDIDTVPAPTCSQVQRCVMPMITGIDRGAIGKEDPYNLRITVTDIVGHDSRV